MKEEKPYTIGIGDVVETESGIGVVDSLFLGKVKVRLNSGLLPKEYDLDKISPIGKNTKYIKLLEFQSYNIKDRDDEDIGDKKESDDELLKEEVLQNENGELKTESIILF